MKENGWMIKLMVNFLNKKKITKFNLNIFYYKQVKEYILILMGLNIMDAGFKINNMDK